LHYSPHREGDLAGLRFSQVEVVRGNWMAAKSHQTRPRIL